MVATTQVILYPQLNSASFGAFVVLGSLLDAFICVYWRLATYLLTGIIIFSRAPLGAVLLHISNN